MRMVEFRTIGGNPQTIYVNPESVSYIKPANAEGSNTTINFGRDHYVTVDSTTGYVVHALSG